MTSIMGRDQHVAVMTFNGFTISDARNVVHADERGGGFGIRSTAWLRDAKVAVGTVLGRSWDGGTRYQVRNTIEAMIRTPEGTDLRVLNGHYEGPEPDGVDHQGRQVAPLAGALDAWDGPTIWGGDFNVQSLSAEGDRERAIMADAGLVDAYDGVDPSRRVPHADRVTDPARPWHPGGGIDRIYTSSHASVLDAHVVREAGDASDHFPVVADLELVPRSNA
jgi:endonuclease/exonuclease/phosphatase family metal-dependent hydrolase